MPKQHLAQGKFHNPTPLQLQCEQMLYVQSHWWYFLINRSSKNPTYHSDHISLRECYDAKMKNIFEQFQLLSSIYWKKYDIIHKAKTETNKHDFKGNTSLPVQYRLR